jgi:hypothetical protein
MPTDVFSTLTPEEAAVLRRLEGWINRVQRIEEILDPAEARALYVRLKRDLDAEFQSISDSQRRPPLNDAEYHWYAGTIHEAYVHLRAETSPAPASWLPALFEVRQDLEHTIFTLRRWDQRIAAPGDLLPAACLHCANELRAIRYFEQWLAPAGGPRVDEPFWITRCRDCERRYSYVPNTGLLLEHRAVILPFSPQRSLD